MDPNPNLRMFRVIYLSIHMETVGRGETSVRMLAQLWDLHRESRLSSWQYALHDLLYNAQILPQDSPAS